MLIALSMGSRALVRRDVPQASRLQTASESMRLRQETLASEVRRLHVAYGAETRPSSHELYAARGYAHVCVRARLQWAGAERCGLWWTPAGECAGGILCVWGSEFANYISGVDCDDLLYGF
jgi:hypothetical protein